MIISAEIKIDDTGILEQMEAVKKSRRCLRGRNIEIAWNVTESKRNHNG